MMCKKKDTRFVRPGFAQSKPTKKSRDPYAVHHNHATKKVIAPHVLYSETEKETGIEFQKAPDKATIFHTKEEALAKIDRWKTLQENSTEYQGAKKLRAMKLEKAYQKYQTFLSGMPKSVLPKQ